MISILLQLRDNIDDAEAFNGVGWYVKSILDGKIQSAHYVDEQQALAIARTMMSQEDTSPNLVEYVESGNNILKSALAEQLKLAEDMAVLIPKLRKRLEQTGEKDV